MREDVVVGRSGTDELNELHLGAGLDARAIAVAAVEDLALSRRAVTGGNAAKPMPDWTAGDAWCPPTGQIAANHVKSLRMPNAQGSPKCWH